MKMIKFFLLLCITFGFTHTLLAKNGWGFVAETNVDGMNSQGKVVISLDAGERLAIKETIELKGEKAYKVILLDRKNRPCVVFARQCYASYDSLPKKDRKRYIKAMQIRKKLGQFYKTKAALERAKANAKLAPNQDLPAGANTMFAAEFQRMYDEKQKMIAIVEKKVNALEAKCLSTGYSPAELAELKADLNVAREELMLHQDEFKRYQLMMNVRAGGAPTQVMPSNPASPEVKKLLQELKAIAEDLHADGINPNQREFDAETMDFNPASLN